MIKEKIRALLPLASGLFLGGLGMLLWQRSLPPEQGSAEEKIDILERDLKKAQGELRAWEDQSPRKRFGATTQDQMRSIAQAIKEGRPVTPDDIFRSFKPLLRDLSPLTERMNLIEIKRSAESLAGAYARKYGLTSEQQKTLMERLVANETAKMLENQNLLESEGVGLKEYMKHERESRWDDASEQLVASMLSGEKREAFVAEKLEEKANRLQSEVDGKLTRLDSIVQLDQKQRDQLFLSLAKTSRHYDPKMKFDGLPEGVTAADGMREKEAIMSVLQPAQRKILEEKKKERLEKQREEAAQLGLSLPDDWDLEEEY